MARTSPARTYQEMSDELAKLIEWFEGDNIDLDEAVIKYSQAIDLLESMEKYLKDTQNTINKIAIKFDQ